MQPSQEAFSGPSSLSLGISCLREILASRDQIANIQWILEKAKEFQENIHFCIVDYMKAFDCVNHNKLWKILQDLGISDCLTCLLRNLYAGQEATVSTLHGTTDWFKLGKERDKAIYCHPVKVSASNAGDLGSIPGSGKSPEEGNGNPLQYSCLGNPMDRGAWWATVHGVTKIQI